MAIYLVQHGKSLSKEQDPEKGMSANGVQETERIAEVAAGYKIDVKRIIHSGKKRALQTAEIFGRYLVPAEGVHQVMVGSLTALPPDPGHVELSPRTVVVPIRV